VSGPIAPPSPGAQGGTDRTRPENHPSHDDLASGYQSLGYAREVTLKFADLRDGLDWDVSQADAGEKWGCRLESYLTDPAEQHDTTKWQTELAFRLRD
jgi:hypothetical protein